MSHYYVYITTNPKKSVLYTGMTNDLESRIIEHYLNRGNPTTFAGKYFAYCLIYYEQFHSPTDAIAREKEIKDWNRSKKEKLINSLNPSWKFMNEDIMPWPPHPDVGTRF